jgi:hypothetical protein
MHPPSARLALLSGSILLLSCGGLPGFAIQAPADGSAGTFMPIDITVFFSRNSNLATLHVELNGHDVTPLLVIDPEVNGRIYAHATAFWDSAWMIVGLNQLVLDIETVGIPRHAESYFTLTGDPYADEVPVGGFLVGDSGGFGAEANVLGPPMGSGLFQGSLDVLSLGLLGRIDVHFTDNVIVDGPGVDFTVFENSFLSIDASLLSAAPFSEPGRVSVSQDGSTWYSFSSCMLVQTEGPYYEGCAGVYPVLSDDEDPHPSLPSSTPILDLIGLDILGPPIEIEGSGGDSFDLADVGLSWARYVRIDAASFVDGPFGVNNAGFDLDAVAAVNSVVATDADMNGIPDAVE